MQSIDALFPYVQPESTDCPNAMVRSAILRAAIEFCNKTLAYRTTTPMIPMANTVTVAANVFTWLGTAAVPLLNTRVSFPVSSDSVLVAGTQYFVINVISSTFQISLTPGGAAITGITNNATPFNIVVATFVIAPPSNQDRLVEVLNIWTPNRELIPKSMTEIAMLLPNWQTSQGDPVYYNQPDSATIMLFPLPVNQSATLTIRAAFAPIITATQLGDDLVNLYAEGIAAKAKAILMKMPGSPWTNAVLAGVYEGEFLTRCDEAKIEMLHDRVCGSLSVSPRRFGG